MRHALLSRAGFALLMGGCGSAGSPAPTRKKGGGGDPLSELEGKSATPQGAPIDKTGEIDAQDEQWRKVAEEAFKKYGLQDQQKIAESQEWYRQAVAWKDKADFQKARELAQKSVQAWPENQDGRRLLAEVNALIVGGRENFGQQSMAEKAKEQFQVQLEQAQIEITNHIRNGERFYNVREYDKAIRELEDATFKIKN